MSTPATSPRRRDEPAPGDRRRRTPAPSTRCPARSARPRTGPAASCGHEDGQPAADGDEHERDGDDPAHAEAVHQRGGERRGQAVEQEVERRPPTRSSPSTSRTRRCSGSISTPGAARKPAAPMRATNARRRPRPTATAGRRCGADGRRASRRGACRSRAIDPAVRPASRRVARKPYVQGSGHAAPTVARVAVLALPTTWSASTCGIAPQMFGTAATRRAAALRRPGLRRSDGGPVRTSAGFTRAGRARPGGARRGGHRRSCLGIHCARRAATGSCRRGARGAARGARGARMVSICTGAFVLAAAGLLDGRPATTHWAHADRFRRLLPAGGLDADVLFVDDGDVADLRRRRGRHRPVPAHRCAATTAPRSPTASRARCVVAPWRDGGQAQFIERPLARRRRGSTGAGPRLGAGAPRRAARPGRAGRARAR